MMAAIDGDDDTQTSMSTEDHTGPWVEDVTEIQSDQSMGGQTTRENSRIREHVMMHLCSVLHHGDYGISSDMPGFPGLVEPT